MNVDLQFTQQDRDMLRDTNRDVKRILDFYREAEKRIQRLETWITRVTAVCAFVGFALGIFVKLVSH